MSTRRSIYAVCALFLWFGVRQSASAAESFEKGVALGLFSEDAGWSYRLLLVEIASLGASHVELVVPLYQEHGGSTSLGLHPRFSPSVAGIRRTIREARALGLRVLVFPIVRLSAPRAPSEWRGTLAPSDRAAWFASYAAVLKELARIAAEENAAALSVGSELSTLDVDVAPWRALVAEVRRRFHGELTYSGNWDHFEKVAIYELVDKVGICAYFSLGERKATVPAVAELEERWRSLRTRLARFASAIHRPLLFTEVGYRSILGSSAEPWNEEPGGIVSVEEQRRAYEAFVNTWRGAPSELLVGLYFWNWYGWGGPTSRGYTPRGKPAAEIVKSWFAPR
jgi:hypothetical protein